MSLNVLSPSESQSLLDAGYTVDVIHSVNDFYQQNELSPQLIKTDLSNFSTSSIVQHIKEQNNWNLSEMQTFYHQLRKSMKMQPSLSEQRNSKRIINHPSLSLAQSVSSDSELSSSMPLFIDDNSISASFPSIHSAFSPFSYRKQKHVTITAPCSPITEAYSLDYMNQFTSNITNVTDVTYTNESEFHVLDMSNCNPQEVKEDYDMNVKWSMKQIIVGLIHNISPKEDESSNTMHGNEQKKVHDVEECSTPKVASIELCEDTNDEDDIMWSPEEQNGFVYMDDDIEMQLQHQDIDVAAYDECVESQMKDIVINIMRAVEQSAIRYSEIRQTSTNSYMKSIILGIVSNVSNHPKSTNNTACAEGTESVHILNAFTADNKEEDHDTVLVIDRPSRVKEEQIMEKHIVETVSIATECIHDRSQQIKEEQIAQKDEQMTAKEDLHFNVNDSMKQTILDLIQNITSTEDDITKEEEEEVVVPKRLSLGDQSHYKSDTMVVIEPSELNCKRYSIVVEAPQEAFVSVQDTIIEEEDEEDEDQEEEEEENDDFFLDDLCILSESEQKLFMPQLPDVKVLKTASKKRHQSSFFVSAKSEKKLKSNQRDIVAINEINAKEEEEIAVDPFDIYREYPQEPCDSIQVQRIAYLLSQYQGLNEKKLCKNNLEKGQCVVQFIRNGNIDSHYTEESLLNDWYFILVHYCDDYVLFDKLTQYLSSQMSACDVLKCAFIKRNYKQYITNNTDPSYYEYNEEEQQTRIRFLDRIHCHLLHSHDFGFRLSKSEREYVEDEAGDNQKVAKNEKYLKDKHFLRLRRTLSDKIKILKHVIGPKRRSVNKFVTQIFHAGFSHNNMSSSWALSVPEDISGHIKRPTKIEINDNYQFGQKFYYWDYHKKAGWKWFIHARYHSLKQEMISNKLLTAEQWNMYYHEATLMAKTFVAKSYVPSIEKYFGNYFYGIRHDDILSVDHILAVLLFSNDYKLQVKLNASYAKRSEHESDPALKQRHSYYVNWAKLLCEAVEVFVNTQFYKRVTDFYHNTNCRMYFNDVYASLYTPTSMTRSLQVATCYANERGLMLHFELEETEAQSSYTHNNHYFECNWISSWSNENEILFVGSAAPLNFKSVIQWKLAYNYMHYIAAIAITRKMLHGDPLTDEEAITEPIMSAIKDLITHQINKEKRKKFVSQGIGQSSAVVNIADFIYEFFNHFVQNTTYHIQFDLYKMNYDYFEMRKFFFTKNGEWLNFEQLFTLFPNVRYLTVVPGWSADDCALKLTSQRMCDLYELLQNLKEISVLERIAIDQPNTMQLSLKKVMRDFKPMYASIGWHLDCCGWKKTDDSDPQLIIVKNSQ